MKNRFQLHLNVLFFLLLFVLVAGGEHWAEWSTWSRCDKNELYHTGDVVVTSNRTRKCKVAGGDGIVNANDCRGPSAEIKICECLGNCSNAAKRCNQGRHMKLEDSARVTLGIDQDRTGTTHGVKHQKSLSTDRPLPGNSRRSRAVVPLSFLSDLLPKSKTQKPEFGKRHSRDDKLLRTADEVDEADYSKDLKSFKGFIQVPQEDTNLQNVETFHDLRRLGDLSRSSTTPVEKTDRSLIVSPSTEALKSATEKMEVSSSQQQKEEPNAKILLPTSTEVPKTETYVKEEEGAAKSFFVVENQIQARPTQLITEATEKKAEETETKAPPPSGSALKPVTAAKGYSSSVAQVESMGSLRLRDSTDSVEASQRIPAITDPAPTVRKPADNTYLPEHLNELDELNRFEGEPLAKSVSIKPTEKYIRNGEEKGKLSLSLETQTRARPTQGSLETTEETAEETGPRVSSPYASTLESVTATTFREEPLVESASTAAVSALQNVQKKQRRTVPSVSELSSAELPESADSLKLLGNVAGEARISSDKAGPRHRKKISDFVDTLKETANEEKLASYLDATLKQDREPSEAPSTDSDSFPVKTTTEAPPKHNGKDLLRLTSNVNQPLKGSESVLNWKSHLSDVEVDTAEDTSEPNVMLHTVQKEEIPTRTESSTTSARILTSATKVANLLNTTEQISLADFKDKLHDLEALTNTLETHNRVPHENVQEISDRIDGLMEVRATATVFPAIPQLSVTEKGVASHFDMINSLKESEIDQGDENQVLVTDKLFDEVVEPSKAILGHELSPFKRPTTAQSLTTTQRKIELTSSTGNGKVFEVLDETKGLRHSDTVNSKQKTEKINGLLERVGESGRNTPGNQTKQFPQLSMSRTTTSTRQQLLTSMPNLATPLKVEIYRTSPTVPSTESVTSTQVQEALFLNFIDEIGESEEKQSELNSHHVQNIADLLSDIHEPNKGELSHQIDSFGRLLNPTTVSTEGIGTTLTTSQTEITPALSTVIDKEKLLAFVEEMTGMEMNETVENKKEMESVHDILKGIAESGEDVLRNEVKKFLELLMPTAVAYETSQASTATPTTSPTMLPTATEPPVFNISSETTRLQSTEAAVLLLSMIENLGKMDREEKKGNRVHIQDLNDLFEGVGEANKDVLSHEIDHLHRLLNPTSTETMEMSSMIPGEGTSMPSTTVTMEQMRGATTMPMTLDEKEKVLDFMDNLVRLEINDTMNTNYEIDRINDMLKKVQEPDREVLGHEVNQLLRLLVPSTAPTRTDQSQASTPSFATTTASVLSSTALTSAMLESTPTVTRQTTTEGGEVLLGLIQKFGETQQEQVERDEHQMEGLEEIFRESEESNKNVLNHEIDRLNQLLNPTTVSSAAADLLTTFRAPEVAETPTLSSTTFAVNEVLNFLEGIAGLAENETTRSRQELEGISGVLKNLSQTSSNVTSTILKEVIQSLLPVSSTTAELTTGTSVTMSTKVEVPSARPTIAGKYLLDLLNETESVSHESLQRELDKDINLVDGFLKVSKQTSSEDLMKNALEQLGLLLQETVAPPSASTSEMLQTVSSTTAEHTTGTSVTMSTKVEVPSARPTIAGKYLLDLLNETESVSHESLQRELDKDINLVDGFLKVSKQTSSEDLMKNALEQLGLLLQETVAPPSASTSEMLQTVSSTTAEHTTGTSVTMSTKVEVPSARPTIAGKYLLDLLNETESVSHESLQRELDKDINLVDGFLKVSKQTSSEDLMKNALEQLGLLLQETVAPPSASTSEMLQTVSSTTAEHTTGTSVTMSTKVEVPSARPTIAGKYLLDLLNETESVSHENLQRELDKDINLVDGFLKVSKQISSEDLMKNALEQLGLLLQETVAPPSASTSEMLQTKHEWEESTKRPLLSSPSITSPIGFPGKLTNETKEQLFLDLMETILEEQKKRKKEKENIGYLETILEPMGSNKEDILRDELDHLQSVLNIMQGSAPTGQTEAVSAQPTTNVLTPSSTANADKNLLDLLGNLPVMTERHENESGQEVQAIQEVFEAVQEPDHDVLGEEIKNLLEILMPTGFSFSQRPLLLAMSTQTPATMSKQPKPSTKIILSTVVPPLTTSPDHITTEAKRQLLLDLIQSVELEKMPKDTKMIQSLETILESSGIDQENVLRDELTNLEYILSGQTSVPTLIGTGPEETKTVPTTHKIATTSSIAVVNEEMLDLLDEIPKFEEKDQTKSRQEVQSIQDVLEGAKEPKQGILGGEIKHFLELFAPPSLNTSQRPLLSSALHTTPTTTQITEVGTFYPVEVKSPQSKELTTRAPVPTSGPDTVGKFVLHFLQEVQNVSRSRLLSNFKEDVDVVEKFVKAGNMTFQEDLEKAINKIGALMSKPVSQEPTLKVETETARMATLEFSEVPVYPEKFKSPTPMSLTPQARRLEETTEFLRTRISERTTVAPISEVAGNQALLKILSKESKPEQKQFLEDAKGMEEIEEIFANLTQTDEEVLFDEIAKLDQGLHYGKQLILPYHTTEAIATEKLITSNLLVTPSVSNILEASTTTGNREEETVHPTGKVPVTSSPANANEILLDLLGNPPVMEEGHRTESEQEVQAIQEVFKAVQESDEDVLDNELKNLQEILESAGRPPLSTASTQTPTTSKQPKPATKPLISTAVQPLSSSQRTLPSSELYITPASTEITEVSPSLLVKVTTPNSKQPNAPVLTSAPAIMGKFVLHFLQKVENVSRSRLLSDFKEDVDFVEKFVKAGKLKFEEDLGEAINKLGALMSKPFSLKPTLKVENETASVATPEFKEVPVYPLVPISTAKVEEKPSAAMSVTPESGNEQLLDLLEDLGKTEVEISEQDHKVVQKLEKMLVEEKLPHADIMREELEHLNQVLNPENYSRPTTSYLPVTSTPKQETVVSTAISREIATTEVPEMYKPLTSGYPTLLPRRSEEITETKPTKISEKTTVVPMFEVAGNQALLEILSEGSKLEDKQLLEDAKGMREIEELFANLTQTDEEVLVDEIAKLDQGLHYGKQLKPAYHTTEAVSTEMVMPTKVQVAPVTLESMVTKTTEVSPSVGIAAKAFLETLLQLRDQMEIGIDWDEVIRLGAFSAGQQNEGAQKDLEKALKLVWDIIRGAMVEPSTPSSVVTTAVFEASTTIEGATEIPAPTPTPTAESPTLQVTSKAVTSSEEEAFLDTVRDLVGRISLNLPWADIKQVGALSRALDKDAEKHTVDELGLVADIMSEIKELENRTAGIPHVHVPTVSSTKFHLLTKATVGVQKTEDQTSMTKSTMPNLLTRMKIGTVPTSKHFNPPLPTTPYSPVDRWTEWSAWGDCSATCGLGEQSRIRECQLYIEGLVIPSSSCEGSRTENMACETRLCPGGVTQTHSSQVLTTATPTMMSRLLTMTDVSKKTSRYPETPLSTTPYSPVDRWTEWSAWGDCSATCGLGEQSRTRECQLYIEGLVIPSSSCEGSRTENMACETRLCPGGVTQTHSSQVLTTATPTMMSRLLTMTDGSKKTSRYPETPLSTTPYSPVDRWTEWSAWGDCSATCGLGEQSRTRECQLYTEGLVIPSSSCEGSRTENMACETRLCPGGVTHTHSSRVLTTATPTMMSRLLTMTDVSKKTSRYPETPLPTTPYSPVDRWTEWSAWGDCSATCGLGEQSRTRECQLFIEGLFIPASGCEGSRAETMACETRRCPVEQQMTMQCSGCSLLPPGVQNKTPSVDGQWSGWSDWTECSAVCGPGKQTRYRLCDSPPPAGDDGLPCEGAMTDDRDCYGEGKVCEEAVAEVPARSTPKPSDRAPTSRRLHKVVAWIVLIVLIVLVVVAFVACSVVKMYGARQYRPGKPIFTKESQFSSVRSALH